MLRKNITCCNVLLSLTEVLRRTLHLLMSHYFRSEEGGERSVCLAFGFLSLLIAMLVLVVREDYLEFGLEPGMWLSDLYF